MGAVRPFLAVVLCTGCVWNLDEESLGRSRLGRVVGDCIVPRPAELSGWGAPVSVEFPDRSLWIWEEVTTATGTSVRNVGAFVADPDDACAGDLVFVEDAGGAPVSLVSLAWTQPILLPSGENATAGKSMASIAVIGRKPASALCQNSAR